MGAKELEISEEEAKKLSEASKDVLQHYKFGLSDRAMAWVNLSVVACGVYAPRFMAMGVRKGSERRARVVEMPSKKSAGENSPPAPPVNGHAGGMTNINLTPPFVTAPPENEDLP